MTTAVLTGRVHVGKTTICREVAQRAQARGCTVRGVLTLPVVDAVNARLGLQLLDLESGEQRLLASVNTDLGGPTMGAYHFDRIALQWGERVLATACGSPCDLLVLDEIGRLELEQNLGFQLILALLACHPVPRTLLVIRDTLLHRFRVRLPELCFTTFEATMDNRDLLPAQIHQFLFDTGRR